MEGTGRCDAPFTESRKLEKGNEYLSLPVLKLWVSSAVLPPSPYTGGSHRAQVCLEA